MSGVPVLEVEKMDETSGNVQIVFKTINNEGIIVRNSKQYTEKGEEVKTTEYFLDLQSASTEENEGTEYVTVGEDEDPEFVSVAVADSEEVLNHKEVIVWDELCRICANSSEQFIPIFSDEGLEHELFSKIQSYLPLKVSENDTLPHQVCYNCAATILSWHDLYKNCSSAQQRLLELQSKLNSKDQFFNENSTEEENVGNILEVETASDNQEYELSLKEEEEEEEEESEKIVKEQIEEASEEDPVPNRYANLEEDNSVIIITASDLDSLPAAAAAAAALSNNNQSESVETVKVPSKQTVAERKAEAASAKRVVDGHAVYQCPECPKRLSTAYNYTAHRRVHAQERTSNCGQCGKCFSTQSSLTRHVREVHKKIKLYKCEYCERRLATRVSRDEHQRTHTDERPHRCDVCDKRFRQRASLSVHKRFHSSSISFSCGLCNKVFRRKQDVQRHELTHTNLAPYECNVCKKSFRSSASAIRHRHSHLAADSKYMCDVCGECCNSEKMWKSHRLKKHKDD